MIETTSNGGLIQKQKIMKTIIVVTTVIAGTYIGAQEALPGLIMFIVGAAVLITITKPWKTW